MLSEAAIMRHRRIAFLLIVGVFIVFAWTFIAGRTALEISKDRWVSAYRPFQKVAVGMDQRQVRGLLGVPRRTRLHSDAVAWTPTQLKQLYDEDDRLMTALRINPSLKKQFDRLMTVRSLEEKRVRETWFYPEIPGWRGDMEIYFDCWGRVTGKNSGYG
jgi:hypothetical protein